MTVKIFCGHQDLLHTYIYEKDWLKTVSHMTTVATPDKVGKRKLTYHYDGLARTLRRDFYANGNAHTETDEPLLQTEYCYEAGGYGTNSTTMRVQSIALAGQQYEYSYDKLGNITRESWQGKTMAGGISLLKAAPYPPRKVTL